MRASNAQHTVYCKQNILCLLDFACMTSENYRGRRTVLFFSILCEFVFRSVHWVAGRKCRKLNFFNLNIFLPTKSPRLWFLPLAAFGWTKIVRKIKFHDYQRETLFLFILLAQSCKRYKFVNFLFEIFIFRDSQRLNKKSAQIFSNFVHSHVLKQFSQSNFIHVWEE